MKKFTFFLLGIFIVFTLSAKEVINIASGEWVPLAGKNLKHGGFCGHIVSQAFKNVGFETVFTYLPWKRALFETKEARVDVTPCWIKNEERSKDFLFSDSLLVQKKVFFHRKDFSFDWSSMDDLVNSKIVGVFSYSYGEKFDQAVKEEFIDIYRVISDKQTFEMLLSNRYDLVPMEMVVGYTTINKTFPPALAQSITHHPRAIVESNYHLMFSKQLPADRLKKIIADFNRGLKMLKDSGQYQDMEKSMFEGYYDVIE